MGASSGASMLSACDQLRLVFEQCDPQTTSSGTGEMCTADEQVIAQCYLDTGIDLCKALDGTLTQAEAEELADCS